MTEFMCLVCMYVRPRPDLDEDAQAETELLTVVNGVMVCLRHIDCAAPGPNSKHHTIMSGVTYESQGTMRHLSEYQDWRAKQDRELAGT